MQRPLLACAFFAFCFSAVSGQEPTDLVSFEYQRLELRRVGERWQLFNGRTLIKDLGTNEADAREALGLIRQLQLNQRGTIGTPAPVLEYWLSDRAAPRGIIAAHRLVSFDPQALRAESVHGQWCLRDNRQLYFN